MIARVLLVTASLLGATCVALGAYGAHGLEQRLRSQPLTADEVQRRLVDFDTAVHYQMFHVLALLAVGLLAQSRPNRWWTAPALCFLVGMLLFCGPLYWLALAGVQIHSAVIPAGGSLLILAWILSAVVCALAR